MTDAGNIVDDYNSYFTPQTKITWWMMRGLPCPCWEMASWSRNLPNQQEPLLESRGMDLMIYATPEFEHVVGERERIKLRGVWPFQSPLFQVLNMSPTKFFIL